MMSEAPWDQAPQLSPSSILLTFLRISAQSQDFTSPSPALSRCRSVETML